MDDRASKALGAESVDRMLAETNPGSPTVRTVLRLTDDLALIEQTRSTDGDDLAQKIIGTSSASFLGAVLRMNELREQARLTRIAKQEKADLNLSRVAYESMYGLKTRRVEADERRSSQVRSSRRLSGLAYDASGRRLSRRSLQSAEEEELLETDDEDELAESFRKFDKWTAKHLRRRIRRRPKFVAPISQRPVLDMSLVGLHG
ncbi:mhkC [Symbiodinium pilosum]|uniref:MhkC protein n=1 Tax=Symbiodinium pilosum TaxID=2952 RepID=A0A812R9L0_SYMPI|nr:mhkC [Symbiodinium pilosum]